MEAQGCLKNGVQSLLNIAILILKSSCDHKLVQHLQCLLKRPRVFEENGALYRAASLELQFQLLPQGLAPEPKQELIKLAPTLRRIHAPRGRERGVGGGQHLFGLT